MIGLHILHPALKYYTTVVYKKEFALLPIQVDSGEFCFLKFYYTKYITLDAPEFMDIKMLGRYTKEEVIIDRLRG